jgi:hypothetical protein
MFRLEPTKALKPEVCWHLHICPDKKGKRYKREENTLKRPSVLQIVEVLMR